MGGSAMDDDWELASQSTEVRTVVLVGCTGNGKSATGNSILGRRDFKSKLSFSGVTRTCELQTTVLEDGHVVNVIDTPGLFDVAVGSEVDGKEIVKCIDLAKDGIHAVLVVLSVTSRFSQEENAAIRCLQTLFGTKIVDYMIVVFTGGDVLEDNEETFEDFLGRECPEPLKEILQLCQNRCVLFDNKTKDENNRIEQVGKLFSLVNSVIEKHGGQPYTDDMFAELKNGAKLCDQQVESDSLKGYSEVPNEQIDESHEKLIKRLVDTVESKLKETITILEEQLKQQQAVQKKSDDEIRELREKLERASDELGNKAQKKSDDEIRELREKVERAMGELGNKVDKGGCAIL